MYGVHRHVTRTTFTLRRPKYSSRITTVFVLQGSFVGSPFAGRAGLSEREFPGMDLNSLKYAKSHEWISVQGQTATVGITDFAVKQLTDLVHIELPRKGRTIRQGETFGEVESVKAVSDLYAPASGEIVEVNEALADDLGVLSDDPFGKGWMMKLKLSDPSSLSGLMDRAAYEAHCADESEHA